MAQRRAAEPAIRIVVVRSGGVAGIRQRWQVESQDDAEEWFALVRACPWGAVGNDPSSRDRFVWRIEARMPPAVRTASVPDALLVGPWRVLVDRVRELGSHG
jgi:hypothetical protein